MTSEDLIASMPNAVRGSWAMTITIVNAWMAREPFDVHMVEHRGMWIVYVSFVYDGQTLRGSVAFAGRDDAGRLLNDILTWMSGDFVKGGCVTPMQAAADA